ncbi:PREDICTED: uncharacterized protein LOC108759130 [Trachymyrmex cornetzi]|uniref:uncharacterized protein LOC108759130 n=1 Tax=Trachymyrmex cornetzi TaxID=471704 RepID=UPI00084F5845|nr:PREDICTED: uncharacterized protein LOC108759130 [Trachymyrmex cornetzi]
MICSQHFDASYFIQPSKEKSLFYSQKRLTKLRADAIPTLHLTFDTSQVEATHVDKRPLPLIDTSDTLESTCNGTLTSESKCNDTVLPDTFSDDIPVSQEIQLIHNTPILSTSKDVTVLSEKLKSVQQQLALAQNKLRIYEEKQEKCNENLEAQMYDLLGKSFTPGQIRCFLNPSKKNVKWSSEDIANAISLRSVSPKAYRYLRNVLRIPLPNLSTLRRYVPSLETSA